MITGSKDKQDKYSLTPTAAQDFRDMYSATLKNWKERSQRESGEIKGTNAISGFLYFKLGNEFLSKTSLLNS